VQYQVYGRRQSHTCSQRSTLLEVLEELSIPGTNLCDACVGHMSKFVFQLYRKLVLFL
jgi:hypothetical protein